MFISIKQWHYPILIMKLAGIVPTLFGIFSALRLVSCANPHASNSVLLHPLDQLFFQLCKYCQFSCLLWLQHRLKLGSPTHQCWNLTLRTSEAMTSYQVPYSPPYTKLKKKIMAKVNWAKRFGFSINCSTKFSEM